MNDTIKVMLVDDHTLFRKGLAELLEQRGDIKVAGIAGNADDAMRLLAETKPDVVITDLNMPRMRGFDFLRHVRRLGLAPRYTFVLTSVRNQEELMEIFREGVDGILLKPFQAEDLIQKINEIRERLV